MYIILEHDEAASDNWSLTLRNETNLLMIVYALIA